MTHQTPASRSELAALTPDRPIAVKVAGADLLLSGRFDHWRPVAMATDDADHGSVQILFDATGTASHDPKAGEKNLFSYAARSVERTGEHTYAAKGTLRSDGVARSQDATIQIPTGHSPFFFLTLTMDRRLFAGLWVELQVRAGRTPEGEELGMRPRAWIRVPDLAAA